MFTRWREGFRMLLPRLFQFGDARARVVLAIPNKTLEAIGALKLLPKDDITQVFRDALETHSRVVGTIRTGGTLHVHKGATIVPLNVEHLTTPAVRRGLFEVIKGDLDD